MVHDFYQLYFIGLDYRSKPEILNSQDLYIVSTEPKPIFPQKNIKFITYLIEKFEYHFQIKEDQKIYKYVLYVKIIQIVVKEVNKYSRVNNSLNI